MSRLIIPNSLWRKLPLCSVDIINTWLPLNCKPISWAKNKEGQLFSGNNMAAQSMRATLCTVWIR